jgi:hypothetical protein
MRRGAELITVRDNRGHSLRVTVSVYLHSNDVQRARQLAVAFDLPAR